MWLTEHSIVYSLIIHVSEIEVHSKCEGILHANVSSQMCKHDNKQYSIWFHTTEDIWQFQFYSKCLITKNVNVLSYTNKTFQGSHLSTHGAQPNKLSSFHQMKAIHHTAFYKDHFTWYESFNSHFQKAAIQTLMYKHNRMSKKILTKAKNHIFTKFWQTESFCTD